MTELPAYDVVAHNNRLRTEAAQRRPDLHDELVRRPRWLRSSPQPAGVTVAVQHDPSAVPDDWPRGVYMHQVHGNGVAVVDGFPEELTVADALVTATPNLPLVVRTGDCVPLLLADPAAGVVAAVHAGRAGVVAGVVPAALAVMAELGATARSTRGWIGPSICGACYEVGEQIRAEVAAVTSDAAATTRWGTAGVDCGAGVLQQLHEAGVQDVRVHGACTYEDHAYFSYRRDRTPLRQWAAVQLGDAPW